MYVNRYFKSLQWWRWRRR